MQRSKVYELTYSRNEVRFRQIFVTITNWLIIAVRDNRSNIHWNIPFPLHLHERRFAVLFLMCREIFSSFICVQIYNYSGTKRMKARCPQSHFHWFALTRTQFDDVEARIFVQSLGAMSIGSVGVEAHALNYYRPSNTYNSRQAYASFLNSRHRYGGRGNKISSFWFLVSCLKGVSRGKSMGTGATESRAKSHLVCSSTSTT